MCDARCLAAVVAYLLASEAGVSPRLAAAQDRLLGEAPPHLVVVTFDTTRADRIGCYGYPGIDTPSIDRLAREGVLFTRAYCQAVQTLPSHASLFTGLYPITNDVVSNGQSLSDQAVTLAELLRSNGYQTGAIVATAPLMRAFNLDQGFDTYVDSFEGSAFRRAFHSFFRIFSFNKLNIRTTRPAQRVAALARKWLRRAARKKRPFFLWIHFIEPHYPYQFHPDFDKPKRVVSDGELNVYGEKESNYLNEIEFADYYLGQVLSYMDEVGLTGKTLTIFTADHGESLGEHGYRGHRQEVYEPVIRVPLIFRFPGRLPAGKSLETPAMLVDVMPTVLDLSGVPFDVVNVLVS
ncbi:MAG: sulfatase, partial [Acidobacteriota bacterium]